MFWRLLGIAIAMLLASVYGVQGRLIRLFLKFFAVDRNRITKKRGARRPRLETTIAWEVLGEIQRLANQTGARVFPVSGTLLGIYRNGGILKHDVDIDIGLFDDDPAFDAFLNAVRSSPLCSGFKDERFSPFYRKLNPWLPPLRRRAVAYKVMMRSPASPGAGPVEVDIFVHFPALGYVAHGIWTRLWINSVFALRDHEAGGLKLLVPQDIERYLAENYGDFRTEKPDFENAVDCPNCVFVSGLGAPHYVQKMQRLYLFAGWTERSRILDMMCRDLARQLLNGGKAPHWRIRGLDGNQQSVEGPR